MQLVRYRGSRKCGDIDYGLGPPEAGRRKIPLASQLLRRPKTRHPLLDSISLSISSRRSASAAAPPGVSPARKQFLTMYMAASALLYYSPPRPQAAAFL